MKTVIKVTNNKGELGTLGTFECEEYGALRILKDAFDTLADSPYFNREVKFESEFYKSKFEIEGCEYGLDGYTTGETWNGWACPYFTKEFGLKVCDLLSSATFKGWYDEATDSFKFDEIGCKDSLEEFEGMDIIVDGSIEHVYPIGAWCWVWDEADKEEEQA